MVFTVNIVLKCVKPDHFLYWNSQLYARSVDGGHVFDYTSRIQLSHGLTAAVDDGVDDLFQLANSVK